MDIRVKAMETGKKVIIDETYHACMNHTAIEEQKLLWELANAIHCVRTNWMANDEMTAKKILYENDYTVGRN